MAIQYDTIANKDFSKGMDSYSAKNNIQPGHTSTLRNVDVNASGVLSTRKGYERYFGQLPIRISKIAHTAPSGGNNGKIRLTLDDSQTIDLSTTQAGPIVVGGRLNYREIVDSTGGTYDSNTVGGDFSEDINYQWYDTYTLVNRQTLSMGDNTLSIGQASHGVSSKYLFTGLAEATLSSGNSNLVVMPAAVRIDETLFDVEIDYTDYTETGDGFFYFKEKSAVAGTTYIHPITASTSETILSTTHNLSNTNIGVRCYESAAGTATEVIPASVTINTSGDVTITFDTAVTGWAIITACPVANRQVSTSLTLNAYNTITVPSPGGAFCFYYIYARSGGTLTQATVASIEYDSSTDSTAISYYLGGIAEQVELYWEEADSVANVIEITDSDAVTCNAAYEDNAPSMVVYGIPHDNIYKDTTLKGGHVVHLDVYKSAGEERVIAGLGGNIYGAYSYSEYGSTGAMGSSYVHLKGRTDALTNMAPLFDVTGSAVSRTRGLVTDASISGNKAQVTSISYISSGVMDVVLAFTALDAAIDNTKITPNIDKLTITNAGYSVNSGSFIITAIQAGGTLGATSVTLRVANSACVSADTDETNSGAEAGVFTDRFAIDDASDFQISGTTITSSILDTAETYTSVGYVMGAQDYVYMDNVTEAIAIPDGVLMFAGLSTNVIPVATSGGTGTVENFVVGDTIALTGYDRKFRIKAINANADITHNSCTIATAGTLTVTVGSAIGLNVGDYVMVHTANGDIPAGIYPIAAVDNTTIDLTISSSVTVGTSDDVTLVGHTLYVDETFTLADTEDTVHVQVEGRFIPFEAPYIPFTLYESYMPEYTHISHFAESAYEQMPTVRSTMVSDNLYLTDGVNGVKKIDGAEILQAGLPYWQPMLYAQWDTTTAAIIAGHKLAYNDSSAIGKYFAMDTTSYQVGDRVYDTYSQQIYTVVETSVHEVAHGSSSAQHFHVIVNGGDTTGIYEGDPGPHYLILVNNRKYYARLNYLDANDNIIASAATGYNDMVVEQTESGQCKLRLVGLPDYGLYDYAKLEVELYRTVALNHGASETFYLVHRSLMSYENALGYIDITDAIPDELLVEGKLDVVHSALLGNELGTNWDSPKVAKYITSVDNRLVTANLTADPVFNIQVLPSGAGLGSAHYNGASFTFRKDNTDTEDIPNMVDRVKYWATDSGAVALSNISPTGFTFDATADVDAGTDTITENSHGMSTGDAVAFTGTVPGGITLGSTYYINRPTANTFTVHTSYAAALAGTGKVNLSAAVGTCTVTPRPLIASYDGNGTQKKIVYKQAHGLSVGYWIYMFHSAVGTINSLTYAGHYQVVEIIDADSFAIGASVSGASDTAYEVDRWVAGNDVGAVPVWVGTDGNINTKDGNTTGDFTHQFCMRMANAINSSMRMSIRFCGAGASYYQVDDMLSFRPWLRAKAGSTFQTGQLIVEVMQPLTTTAELQMYSGSIGTLFCNGRQTDETEEVSARTYLHPSRVAISFPNYPEITERFVDVNSADGQDITAIIPFFGQSTFGAGNALNQSVVVFKTNSIYLLDTTSGQYVKINSRGIGCTAPYSVAQTKNGIMFASRTGVYRLTHEMQVEYVGRMLEGEWKSNVATDNIDVAAGHYYHQLHQYKLSVPTPASEADNTNISENVLVFKQDNEADAGGAWSTYTNHPTLSWANMAGEAFFASDRGLVMKIRNYGDRYDYRDDDSAVAEQVITLKADDFGIPGVRKVIASIITSLDLTTDLTSVIIEAAMNLSSSYDNCGTVNINLDEYTHTTFRASPAVRKGGYIQVRYRHSVKDECLTFTGVAYKVGRLDINGTIETANLT